LANVNLVLFVYAHTYVLGLTNEKYVMRTYVACIWEQHWWRPRERERQKDEAQGIVPHLFSFK